MKTLLGLLRSHAFGAISNLKKQYTFFSFIYFPGDITYHSGLKQQISARIPPWFVFEIVLIKATGHCTYQASLKAVKFDLLTTQIY